MDIVIVGFGNIGQTVFRLTRKIHPKIWVRGIVTRNPVRAIRDGAPENLVVGTERGSRMMSLLAKKSDVAILCGGSKADLPVQGPYWAGLANTVDSFDTHDHVGEYLDEETGLPRIGYFRQMDLVAKATGHTALVCQGWDPGLFSNMRALFQAVLGEGVRSYAFYGLTKTGGLSMGHSDAIRSIPGVVDARQFTHAKPEAIEWVRAGENPVFTPGDMHWRQCIVATESVDSRERERIREAIIGMPGYFAPFQTEVEFVLQEELYHRFPGMPHDGLVIAKSDNGLMEFRVEWQSNAEATARILLAAARATCNFQQAGRVGAFSSLAVASGHLFFESEEEMLHFV
ncbi:MAG: diaminopimelate dehydrogenase [Patescibacteria group bacterium]